MPCFYVNTLYYIKCSLSTIAMYRYRSKLLLYVYKLCCYYDVMRERNVLFNDALTKFIYGYMASDIWLRTILIVRKETRCRHIGYSYRLTARVLLYAPSHRQDNTYHGLCYTSRGALVGTRNSSMGPPNEGSIRDPSHHERTLYLWATSRSHDVMMLS